MNNLTHQSRAYFQGVFIDTDISRFQILLNGIHYKNFVTGIMFVFWLLVAIGWIINNPIADVSQAVGFGSKMVVIIIKAIGWGLFG